MIFGALALLSLALTVWQWALAFRFPLHRRLEPDLTWIPPLTLLKPLKGVDDSLAQCLESWLAQPYPREVQFLFGVASADDPACPLVRDLITRFPKAGAQLVICPENLGANAKVSTLIQLMRLARHEVIIVSDADVWVPEGFLGQVVAPLKDPAFGLVNCFYQMTTAVVKRPAPSVPGMSPKSHSAFGMRWEAFAVNADFWAQVLQAQTLKPLDFALGAVMATTRAHLAKIGGFESLADYLADDYQLGHQIARNGGKLALSPIVVECWSAPMSWREVWHHQLRWARTIRVCQPVPYFFSQVHNPILWPWLWAAVSPGRLAWTFAAAVLLIRMATAFYCEGKLTRRADFDSLWLAPVKDLLQTVVWVLAFFGRRIEWRGQRYRVSTGGKLVKCELPT